MTATAKKEHSQGITGEMTIEGKSLSVPWVIDITDEVDADNGLIIASRAPELPLPGMVHPYDKFLFVKNVSIKNDGPKSFIAHVNYESIGNPLINPPKKSWSFAASNEPVDVDIYGNPICGSSYEGFDPPPTEDIYDLVLRIEWNSEAFDALLAADYQGAVNEDHFMVFGPGIARIINFSASEEHTPVLSYYKITIEIQFRIYGEAGWSRRFIDKGMREIAGSENKTITDENNHERTITVLKYKEILDKEEIPVTEPVFLDGRGHELPLGHKVAFKTFETKKKRPFSALNLE